MFTRRTSAGKDKVFEANLQGRALAAGRIQKPLQQIAEKQRRNKQPEK